MVGSTGGRQPVLVRQAAQHGHVVHSQVVGGGFVLAQPGQVLGALAPGPGVQVAPVQQHLPACRGQQARQHPQRSVLLRVLGDTEGEVQLDESIREAVPGDRWLLCSDGLWGTLSDEDISRQLATDAVAQSVPELVEQALRKAGESSDNVTVVAMEWETPDAFESTQGVSTESIGDDVFASTIQAGPLDALVDDLDDEAIERSIEVFARFDA